MIALLKFSNFLLLDTLTEKKFIYNRFDKMVRAMFGGDAKKYIGEICLPDGRWWFKIFRLKNGEYDYYIPETKEQNAILAKELTLNKN